MNGAKTIYAVLGAVIIFIVGAALGGMFIRIQYLENNNKVAPVAAPSAAVPNQPQAPTVVNVAVGPNDPVLGDPKAKVTMVEFADYQCPYCEQFYTQTWPQIKTNYVDTGKVKFVYKNLVVNDRTSSEHESHDSAIAALCAKDQNKFWEYHDYLFKHQNGEGQGAFSNANLKKFAVDLGLDSGQFNSCLDSNKYDSQIQADMAEAGKWGFSATPYAAVGTTPIMGAQPYAQFKTVIDAELAKS